MSLFSSSSLFSEDDEDSSFAGRPSSGKSKLGSLFGGDATKAAGNESLQYNRPKQPKKDGASPTAASKKVASPAADPAPTYPTILVAVGAILYKFDTETQKWSSGGKVGCAIVENKTGATKFQIILYYTKTQIICTAPIAANFVYTPQFSNNEHFGNFYDSNKQNWSIRFETSDDSDNLAIHVALAKYIEKGAGALNELIMQDLFVPAKSNPVVEGDMVGMRYTVWSEQSGKLVKIEDNLEKNAPLRLVLGQKKGPVGLDAAVEGMRKSGRRAVVVPPGYDGNTDSEAKVYKLTLEKLKRVNSAADVETPAAAPAKPASPQQPPQSRSRASSDADAASLSDLPSVGEAQTDKAALLKRIAKMGVATLGNHPDAQEWETTAPAAEPTPTPVPVQTAPQAVPQMPQQQPQPQYQQPQQPYMQQQQLQQPYMQMGMSGMNPYGQQPGFPMGMVNQPYGSNPYMQQQQQQPGNQLALISGPNPFAQQFLLAQAQAQQPPVQQPTPVEPAKPAPAASDNAETIKVLVEERQLKSEINSKLDKVEKYVEDVKGMMEESMFLGKAKDLAPGVSSKQLLVTIQRIVMENEKYAAEMDAKSARIESLTEKIAKLHETNQRVVEENNRFLEERSTNYRSSTESTMKQLEQFRSEKLELEMELTKSQKQFQTLKRAYTNLSAEMEEFKQSHDRAKKDAENAVSRAAILNTQVLDLEEKLRESESMTKRVQAALDQAQVDLEAEREQVGRLTQIMEEHKAKFIAELTRREAQWESERTTTGAELEQLREALRRERANMGTTTQQLESELQIQFAAKMKHQLETQENQLNQQRELALEEQRLALENEFRSRVRLLREEQAAQLEKSNQENAQVRAQLVTAQSKLSDLTTQLQNANIFAAAVTTPAQSDSDQVAALKQQLRTVRIQAIKDFEAKVKLVMNGVYQQLNGEFGDDEDQTYNKVAIMGTIRQTIVQTTVQLVQQTQEQLSAQEDQEKEAESQAEVRAAAQAEAAAEAERQAKLQKEREEAEVAARIKAAEELAARAQAEAAALAAAKAQAEAEAAAQAAARAEAEEAAAEARRLAEATRESGSLSAIADEPVEGEDVKVSLGNSVEDVVPVKTEEPVVADPLSLALAADDEEDSKNSSLSFVQALPPAVETEEIIVTPSRSPAPEDPLSSPASEANTLSASQTIGSDAELLAAQASKEKLLDDDLVVAADPLGDSIPEEAASDPVAVSAAEQPTVEPIPVVETPTVVAETAAETPAEVTEPKKTSAADVFGDSISEEIHPLSKGAIFDSDVAVSPAVSTESSTIDPLASLDAAQPSAPKPTSSAAIFDDPFSDSVPSEPEVKIATPSQPKKKAIFDDDDDDEDFMKSVTAKANSKPAAAAAEPPKPASTTASPAPAKKSSLFEIFGDDDDLPSEPKASTPQPSSGKSGRKSLDELFGMDDSASGSSSAPASSTKAPRKRNPLFDDDDEI